MVLVDISGMGSFGWGRWQSAVLPLLFVVPGLATDCEDKGARGTGPLCQPARGAWLLQHGSGQREGQTVSRMRQRKEIAMQARQWWKNILAAVRNWNWG